MQSLPESHGRAGVGQGTKVPVLFLKIFFPIRITSVSMEGDWEGSSTKASDPSRAKAPRYVKKPYFFALEICEGKDLSPRHENHLSCYTKGRFT